MKIVLEIAGETYEVEVERAGSELRLACEGRVARASPEGEDRLALDGRSHRVELRSNELALIDGSPVGFRFAGFAPGGPALGSGAGASVPVRAMMPGRIVRTRAAAGDVVQVGSPLLVLEAMKMQNEVGSPVSGRVVEVAVREGDVVEIGRVLARVQPEARKE